MWIAAQSFGSSSGILLGKSVFEASQSFIIVVLQQLVLVYNITDKESFDEMGRWLAEVKEQTSEDVIIHIVGTKNDVASHDPTQRQDTIREMHSLCCGKPTPKQSSRRRRQQLAVPAMVPSLDSKRSSGFWAQELGWDCCHEVSAKDGEGIDEVFRVITRKLVEQKARKAEQQLAALEGRDTSGRNRPDRIL